MTPEEMAKTIIEGLKEKSELNEKIKRLSWYARRKRACIIKEIELIDVENSIMLNCLINATIDNEPPEAKYTPHEDL